MTARERVGGDGRDPVDRLGQLLGRRDQQLVVAGRDDPLVVRETCRRSGASAAPPADLEADAGVGERDLDGGARRPARRSACASRRPSCAARSPAACPPRLRAARPRPVRADGRRWRRCAGVRRRRPAHGRRCRSGSSGSPRSRSRTGCGRSGFLSSPAARAKRWLETLVAHGREVVGRQAGQIEGAAAGAQGDLGARSRCARSPPALPSGSLRTTSYRVCAGAVVAPGWLTSASAWLDHREVESVAVRPSAPSLRLELDVGQDRDGRAPLDHALHMAKRLQQGCALDGQLHAPRQLRLLRGRSPACPPGASAGAATARARSARRDAGPYHQWLERAAKKAPGAAAGRRLSRGAAGAASRCPRSAPRRSARNSSILRIACITVVWSRPPNLRPISGSERGVSCFARYIATWRGRATARARRADCMSARRMLVVLGDSPLDLFDGHPALVRAQQVLQARPAPCRA